MKFSLAKEKSIDELIDKAAEVVAKQSKALSIDELIDMAAETVASKEKQKQAPLAGVGEYFGRLAERAYSPEVLAEPIKKGVVPLKEKIKQVGEDIFLAPIEFGVKGPLGLFNLAHAGLLGLHSLLHSWVAAQPAPEIKRLYEWVTGVPLPEKVATSPEEAIERAAQVIGSYRARTEPWLGPRWSPYTRYLFKGIEYLLKPFEWTAEKTAEAWPELTKMPGSPVYGFPSGPAAQTLAYSTISGLPFMLGLANIIRGWFGKETPVPTPSEVVKPKEAPKAPPVEEVLALPKMSRAEALSKVEGPVAKEIVKETNRRIKAQETTRKKKGKPPLSEEEKESIFWRVYNKKVSAKEPAKETEPIVAPEEVRARITREPAEKVTIPVEAEVPVKFEPTERKVAVKEILVRRPEKVPVKWETEERAIAVEVERARAKEPWKMTKKEWKETFGFPKIGERKAREIDSFVRQGLTWKVPQKDYLGYYFKDAGKRIRFADLGEIGAIETPTPKAIASAIEFHKGAVEQALKRGEPVPDRVLKDYPDLVKKYKKVPPPVGKPKKPALTDVLKTFEEETGYKAQRFSPEIAYKSGAILKDRKIVEIGEDDHSILTPLPDKITYRFVGDDIYLRIPQNATKGQIETAIKVCPDRFKFVGIDILDETGKRVKSLEREFAIGNKSALRKVLTEALREEKPKPKPEIPEPEDTTFYSGIPVAELPKVIKKVGEKAREWKEKFKDTLYGPFDIEYHFKKLNAPTTGKLFKDYYSRSTAYMERDIEKIAPKLRDIPKEYDYKVALKAEQKNPTFEDIPEEIRPKIKQATEDLAKYFEESYKELEEKGILKQPFQERLLEDLQRQRRQLLSQKPRDPKKMAQWEEELAKLDKNIERAKDIKFVHLPTQVWFEAIRRENPKRAMKILDLLTRRKRETWTLKNLLDEGVIEPKDVDLSSLLASYARRKAFDSAMMDIINEAKREGLITTEAKPGYISIEHSTLKRLVGEGHYVEPMFEQFLETFLDVGRSTPFEKVMNAGKMLWFWNFFILPMYDTIQGVMLGSMVSPKTPKCIALAIRDMIKRTPEWYEARRWGLTSTPFPLPFEDFTKFADRVRKGYGKWLFDELEHYFDTVKQEKGIRKAKTFPEIMEDLYRFSWGTAWMLDGLIRQISYRYLRERGFSPREAATIASMVHGDYACYDEKTEILTINGWKLFKDVQPSEKVMTLNPRTLEMEYQPIIEKFEYDYIGEMIQCKQKVCDMLVNPTHRLAAVHYTNKEKIRFIEAKDLYGQANKHWSLLATGEWKAESPKEWKYKDIKMPFKAFVAFMGLYLSEGDIDNRGYDVRIWQKERKQDFEEILRQTGLNWRRSKDYWRCSCKQLNEYLKQFGKAEQKYVPSIIKMASKEDIRRFILYYAKGDGYFRNGKLHYIYTASEKMADDLQELILKAGWKSHKIFKKPQKSIIYEEKPRVINGNGGWYIGIKTSSPRITLDTRKFEKVEYSGKIYSVFVPNHIVCVRRNGIVAFNGNSVPTKSKLLKFIPVGRRELNKFFFTPTYKIVMAKLYGKMIQKTLEATEATFKRMLTGKGEIPKETAIYADALVRTVGLVLALDYLLNRMGFRTDQLARKYVREVDTKEGRKELVLTFSGPHNLPQKYIYKLAESVKPGVPSPAKTFMNTMKWELHPFHQILWEVVENRKPNGDPIVPGWDIANKKDPHEWVKWALHMTPYIAQRVFAITQLITGEGMIGDKEAEEAFRRQVGKLMYMTTKPFMFKYTRGLADDRAMWRLRQLEKNYLRELDILDKKSLRGEITEDKYLDRLDDLTDKFEKSCDEVYKQWEKESPEWFRKMKK